MAKIFQTDWATGVRIAINPDGCDDTVTNRYEFSYPAANGPAAGDVIEMGPLLGDTTVVDMYIDTDDLDAGAAASLDVGIMSGTPGVADATRTVDQTFFAGSTKAQSGGIDRITKSSAVRVVPTTADRSIGVKVVAAPATPQAGTLAIVVLSRAK